MTSKLFLLFFVLVRLAFSYSENETSRWYQRQKIRDETLARIISYTRTSWNQTESRQQNFHIFPVLVKMHHYLALVKLFHVTSLDKYFSQNTFLERPYELARTLHEWQNTTNVEILFPIAIFYDQRYTSWHFLEDLKTHFNAETYEISFDPQNEQALITQINKWISTRTLGRQSKKKGLRMLTKDNNIYTVLSFRGCWDITKTTRFETSPRPRRFTPVLSVFAAIKLEDKIDAPSFTAKDTVGYYNNIENKYEAIRIPFNNGEFAMAIILPYYNQSLEIVTNFTVVDYQQLLEQVGRNYENVDYTIPMINSTTFSINEKGVLINRNRLCDHSVFREETFNRNDIHHRRFFVDRPYGMLIYHEQTSIVLMYALVRNPISGVWPISKFQVGMNMFGEEQDIQHISGE